MRMWQLKFINKMEYIESVEEYIKKVNEFYETWSPKKHLFFRGHSDVSYKLVPSVFRPDKENNFYNESGIVKDFFHYAPQHKINYDFINERDKMLADMQHYGIPTRLMDWTIAPLNALFFACCDDLPDDKHEGKDGQIFVFDSWKYWKKIVHKEHHKEKEIHRIHIISRALLSCNWPFDKIKEYIKDKFKYNNFKPEDLLKPFAYISNYTNDRILHQRGAFTIHGHCREDMNYIPDAVKCMEKINIKAEHKQKILKELNHLYINEYSIFPDFEGMSSMIKKYGSLFNVKPFNNKQRRNCECLKLTKKKYGIE